MPQTLMTFETPLVHAGVRFGAKACGRKREDGLWEGWLEFSDQDTGTVLRTGRETTQPNLTDLTYWASGLTGVYLDGALARILHVPSPKEPAEVSPPHFDGPAHRHTAKSSGHEAILNPFSVYEKNPDVLAQELRALRAWHLRQIIRDYDLVDEADVRIEHMTEPELGSLIMQRVRELHP
jgi:hypothetical protein